MTLNQAIANILSPGFTEFSISRKRPTRASIERLSEEYDTPTPTQGLERTVYLVEIRFGVVEDITANPMTHPAVKMLYLSPDGHIHTAFVKTEPNESGHPEPIKAPRPAAARPSTEGRKATKEELKTFLPLLEKVHGIKTGSDNSSQRSAT